MRKALVLTLALVLGLQSLPHVQACGPEYLQPIFVFSESPDLPFSDFTAGKIGIVQPGFGKKTLTIAYRYLNGGTFSTDEQKELVIALNGSPPEDNDDKGIKAWVAARQELFGKDEPIPEIYAERKNGGYDFFPNCARNAFEVAIETLRDRVSQHGADDKRVRDWLAAQDVVFQNCSGGSSIPAEAGADQPLWLRQDRQYQIAAAYFYSLDFEKARSRFEAIAADIESPWHETADYLIARTLVRQASLTRDASKQREAYDRAEAHLKMLLARNSAFNRAEERLLGLIKYRVHPAERIHELSQTLAGRGYDDNLKQNLIDYSWLLDKFQSEVMEEERRREEAAAGKTPEPASRISQEAQQRYTAIQNGELIEIYFYPKKADGEMDYENRFDLELKPGDSADYLQEMVETKLARKLTSAELADLKQKYEEGQSHRQWLLSPNRKWDNSYDDHLGCYQCSEIELAMNPEFLRADDLSDWILTTQTTDPASYSHALKKWRATDSPAWLVTALAKADKSSRQIERLIRAGEKIQRDEPAFASVAYNLIRLKTAAGYTAEARKLADEIISWQAGVLPLSAQNQFLEQRLQLALNVTEYLKYAQRKPIVFYEYGSLGSINQLLAISKTMWYEGYGQTKEEYEREAEAVFKELLPWEDRMIFSEGTIEVLNWHFPTSTLLEMTRSPALPDYLRRELILTVWTRAFILGNDSIAQRISPEVPKVAPELLPLFSNYLDARTKDERERAGIFVLLKFQFLSPFLKDGVPTSSSTEQSNYYLESAWWCGPSLTQYNGEGGEQPRVVPKPGFLSPPQVEAARQERAKFSEVGDAKAYLGRRVLAWAKASPDDKRVPEALFISVKANESYKYGCGGWESDEETKNKAEVLLREHYPSSAWTAKLEEK